MLLFDLTFTEVSEYLKTKDKLIIPIGTCEQHGSHLPLANDILCVEYLASALSDNTGILVAPTVNYGVNLPCDRSLAGTASVTPVILRDTILSVTAWWKQQGFRRFILLTFHGDPFHIEALSGLGDGFALLEPYEIEYADVLERQTTMRHACEAETSVALFLHPEKVRMDQICEHDIPFELFKEYLFHRKENVPDGYVGCLGYPSAATAAKGEALVRRMLDKMMADYDALNR